MRYIMSRKYPITHMKKDNSQEKILDVSAVTAIATIAAVFVGGVISGCMLRKWME